MIINVSIATFEQKVRESFAACGQFNEVFETVFFVPNKSSGDKFDGILAFRVRGGTSDKQQRESILAWVSALYNPCICGVCVGGREVGISNKF